MDRDKLFDYIMDFMPLLHKKIFSGIMSAEEYTRHQIRLLHVINHDNGQPMKYYGEKLMISKPNMSSLVSKMIDENLLKRVSDENDRRIIKISITDNGKQILNNYRDILKNNVFKKISALNDEEIQKLNRNFKEIKEIFDKLD